MVSSGIPSIHVTDNHHETYNRTYHKDANDDSGHNVAEFMRIYEGGGA